LQAKLQTLTQPGISYQGMSCKLQLDNFFLNTLHQKIMGNLII
jgi:hypothetical protein